MNKNFRLVCISLFVAQSLALYLLEGLIPVPYLAPGAKLGIANTVTLVTLYLLPDKKDTLLILLLRILLSSLFGGGPSAFLYSISGALCAFLAMLLLKEYGKNYFSLPGISAAGAVFHHIGQLFTAMLLLHTAALLYYLPILTGIGIFTGLLTGFVARWLLEHLQKLPLISRFL